MVAYASRDSRVRAGDVLGSGTCGNGGCLPDGLLRTNSAVERIEQDASGAGLRLADPAGTAHAVVDEGLRRVPPIQAVTRYALADTTIAGVPVPAGSWVNVSLNSANRDERVFGADSAEFRLGRPGVPITFGAGSHVCIGTFFGRSLIAIALQRLFAALPGLCLDQDRPCALAGFGFRAPGSVPCVWDIPPGIEPVTVPAAEDSGGPPTQPAPGTPLANDPGAPVTAAKWDLVIATPMGDLPMTAELRLPPPSETSGPVTGVLVTESERAELADGRLDGDDATWKVKLSTPLPLTLKFALHRDGDTITGTSKAGMFPASTVTGRVVSE